MDWPLNCFELGSLITPFTIHYSLLPVFDLDHTWNHSIFMANSFLRMFLALFSSVLCCTFSWFSSMLCIYYSRIFFLGSFLGIWAESRGRHEHMFWLWYVPFLWVSVDFIIMLCLCSWSTDTSWNPRSNQNSLASLLDISSDLGYLILMPNKCSLYLLT